MSISMRFNFNSRRLATSEIITDILQDNGENIIVAVAIIKSKVKIDENILLKSIKKLIKYQPALRMKIVSNTKVQKKFTTKRFVEMSKFDIPINIKEGGDRKSWLHIVEEKMLLPFSTEKGPLWKLEFIEFKNKTKNCFDDNHKRKPNSLHIGSDIKFQDEEEAEIHETTPPKHGIYEGVLILKIHQVITDEISLSNLFQDQLIKILNCTLMQIPTKKLFHPLTMLPAAEDVFSEGRKLTWWQKRKIKRKARLLGKRNMKSNSDYNPGQLRSNGKNEESSDYQSRACILPLALMPFASTTFYHQCKEHNVTFMAAFITASCTALALQSFRNRSGSKEDINCSFPYDLRQFTTLSTCRHSLGMWKGHGQINVPAICFLKSAESFWKEVRKVDENIKHVVQEPDKYFANQREAFNLLSKGEDITVLGAINKADIEVSVIDYNDADGKNIDKYSERDNGLISETNGSAKKRVGARTNMDENIKLTGATKSQEKANNESMQARSKAPSSFSKRVSAKMRSRVKKENTQLGEPMVTLEEIYMARSMCDLSNVPVSVNACMFKSRLMCNVTYSSKYVKRSFATGFVDTLLKVIHFAVGIDRTDVQIDAMATLQPTTIKYLTDEQRKYFAALPPLRRALWQHNQDNFVHINQ